MPRMIFAAATSRVSLPPGPQWYVDNAISSSGDGRSWASAWKSFNNINWSLVAGGTLNVSGGPNGKTYVGGTNVRASNVLIRAAVDQGHNGTVTILNDGIINQAGFFITGVHDVTIRGFTITTVTNSNAQTDGIYIQPVNRDLSTYNITIEYNRILIANNGTEHDDCIQTAWGVGNLTIRNNYMAQNNNKTSNAQGMWLTGIRGNLNIYNNIVYLPNSNNTLMSCRPDTDDFDSGGYTPYIINNTFVGGRWGNIGIRNCTTAIVKNNISQHLGDACDHIRLDTAATGDPPVVNIDYNIYFGQTGQPTFNYHEGQFISFQAWQGKGFDAHSRVINPQLVNIPGLDFRIQATSPAINAGVADPRAPVTDYADRTRIAPPDIGAYEYAP